MQKTCLINYPGHSLDECKVLGDFGSNYSKRRPTKDHGNERTTKKKLADFKIIMLLLSM